MTKLTKEIQDQINEFISMASDSFCVNNFNSSITFLKKAWGKLPNDKYLFDDSYHISRYLTMSYQQLGKMEDAKHWAFINMKCDPERADIGEKEFLVGQIFFELNNVDEAIHYFKIAYKKSKGLCFKNQDTKYHKFYKENIK